MPSCSLPGENPSGCLDEGCNYNNINLSPSPPQKKKRMQYHFLESCRPPFRNEDLKRQKNPTMTPTAASIICFTETRNLLFLDLLLRKQSLTRAVCFLNKLCSISGIRPFSSKNPNYHLQGTITVLSSK